MSCVATSVRSHSVAELCGQSHRFGQGVYAVGPGPCQTQDAGEVLERQGILADKEQKAPAVQGSVAQLCAKRVGKNRLPHRSARLASDLTKGPIHSVLLNLCVLCHRPQTVRPRRVCASSCSLTLTPLRRARRKRSTKPRIRPAAAVGVRPRGWIFEMRFRSASVWPGRG